MNFRVGQQVVCVDDKCLDDRIQGIRAAIRSGVVYEIAWAGMHGSHYCVRLVGVVRQSALFPDHPFLARRFRPVVDQKTDISVFTKILDDVSRKVPADAVH